MAQDIQIYTLCLIGDMSQDIKGGSMDLKIRQFLDELIALVNSYDDIPLEARRLAHESVMYNTERASNKAIQSQSMDESQRITQELSQMDGLENVSNDEQSEPNSIITEE